jgi:hypothetical protein
VSILEEIKLLLSDAPCVNYQAFIELVKIAVKNMWGDKVVFTAAYPDKDVDVTPIITHQIETREPGLVGNSGRREIKPRVRYSGTTDKGETYTLWGQWFDYQIRFDVWGSVAEEADKTVLDLENLLAQYTGFFMKKGVSQFILERQFNDRETKAWRTDLTNRTLIYYLRLDETKVTISNSITAIDVNAYISDLLVDSSVSSITTSVGPQTESIGNIDGGTANSLYHIDQEINGGGAGG